MSGMDGHIANRSLVPESMAEIEPDRVSAPRSRAPVPKAGRKAGTTAAAESKPVNPRMNAAALKARIAELEASKPTVNAP